MICDEHPVEPPSAGSDDDAGDDTSDGSCDGGNKDPASCQEDAALIPVGKRPVQSNGQRQPEDDGHDRSGARLN